jgi:phosphoglycerate dehydrogenase-like enzyme
MIIYVDTAFAPKQEQLLKDTFKDDQFIFRKSLGSEVDEKEACLKADIIQGNPKQKEWIEQSQNIKWVQLYSTGFEYYKHLKTSAVFTNMQDYYSEPCAETILAGIMALYRGMDRFTVLKEKKEWVGHKIRTSLHLLENKKIILLGAGNIAKRLAKLLSGFDCTVSFFARSAPEAVLRTSKDLQEAIPDTDIIIGCLPGTPETVGLFSNKMLELMKPDALFCNVGRGNLLEDEMQLVRMLHGKKIAGAVLDVTAAEPLPADHPLWDCENTILSQHSGGGNIEEFDGIAAFFIANFKRYKAGQPLANVVQLERGY